MSENYKTTTFGAFAEIIPGVEGLIHKSQISFDNVVRLRFLSTWSRSMSKLSILIRKKKNWSKYNSITNKPVKNRK